ncbi:MAG: ATP-binding cassette domain-containing protein [Streptosporangiales bacterium]|nr:ATP-binding cassette domain-containing protein [Streptosporangiales bacterium]
MTAGTETAPLLHVDGLVKHFPTGHGLLGGRGTIHAVDDASFTIDAGETLALVGESGCGKSTLAQLTVRLQRPTRGRITFDGRDITQLGRAGLHGVRSRMQMVFQDPFASLDPRMTVRRIVSEPLRVHGRYGRLTGPARVAELLDMVGLGPEHADRFPHEFSGGQRQRIGIARALALNPDLLVLDEPVSALDVSIQAQIVTLLNRLQDELGLAYLFISHDLAVVRYVARRVAVMYLGRIVETGDVGDVYAHPRHPYTRALLSAVPVEDPLDRGSRDRVVLVGDPPTPTDPPSGCPFRTRCWKAQDLCAQERPELTPADGGHRAACHFPEQADSEEAGA